MDITIDDVLRAHDKDGHLVAASDGSVQNTHEMSFGWVLATANGKHLARSYGGCDGRGSSLRAEAVGISSISLFIALMAKHKKTYRYQSSVRVRQSTIDQCKQRTQKLREAIPKQHTVL